MHIIDIWVNCPSIESADAITAALLTKNSSPSSTLLRNMLPGDARLGGTLTSANRYAPIQSAYVWDGAIQQAEEYPIRLKTRADLAPAVETAVRALHPYEVPSIMRIDVEANADYAHWIYKVTRTP